LSYGKKVLDNSAYDSSDWTSNMQKRYLTAAQLRAACDALAPEFVRPIETRLKMACH